MDRRKDIYTHAYQARTYQRKHYRSSFQLEAPCFLLFFFCPLSSPLPLLSSIFFLLFLRSSCSCSIFLSVLLPLSPFHPPPAAFFVLSSSAFSKPIHSVCVCYNLPSSLQSFQRGEAKRHGNAI